MVATGIPQGTFLSPVLFLLYVIISKHLPCHHAFADDRQQYLSFKPQNLLSQPIKATEDCIDEIWNWIIKTHRILSFEAAKHHWLLSATIEGFGVGCLVPKFDEITPTLASLHGLQVKYRVLFEILLLVYKAVHGLAS